MDAKDVSDTSEASLNMVVGGGLNSSPIRLK